MLWNVYTYCIIKPGDIWYPEESLLLLLLQLNVYFWSVLKPCYYINKNSFRLSFPAHSYTYHLLFYLQAWIQSSVVICSSVMMPGGVRNRIPARGVIPIKAPSRINKIPFSVLTKQHIITFIYISNRIS
jgi:hypothetical protein